MNYIRMPVTIHDTIIQSVLIPLQLQAHISVPSGLLQNKQECRPGFSQQLCAVVETEPIQKKATDEGGVHSPRLSAIISPLDVYICTRTLCICTLCAGAQFIINLNNL